MDFVTTKEGLLKELELMQGIVEKKSTIPILANIVIDASKEGLEIRATDLEVGIRTGCEAKVAKPGSVALSAKRLFDIIRYLPDAEVRLKSDEGNWAQITCQKARFRIMGLSPDDFPAIPEFDFGKGIAMGETLAIFIGDRLKGDGPLGVTEVDDERGDLRIVATEGVLGGE